MTVALIFVPAAAQVSFASQCMNYCTAKGYKLFGVNTGDWPAAVNLLVTGVVGVLVLARPEHLAEQAARHPYDLEPRIEFALPPDVPNARRNEVRTRFNRRGAGA